MLRPPEPVLVLGLFHEERAALLRLLESLSPEAWSRPTIAGDWMVKDIVGHLVADDLGRLSRQRDRHRDDHGPTDEEPPGLAIDRINAEWVNAMRRLSPRVLRSLLEFGGHETKQLFAGVDPNAPGPPVDWAGPAPAPQWLDLAREFTERWHHQQQIRLAVGAPLLNEPRFLRPVLATFAFALSKAFHDVDALPGVTAQLRVDGPSGGDWTVQRAAAGWSLWLGGPDSPTASASMDEDTAWRMYVHALDPEELEARSTLSGDLRLATRILNAFALVS